MYLVIITYRGMHVRKPRKDQENSGKRCYQNWHMAISHGEIIPPFFVLCFQSLGRNSFRNTNVNLLPQAHDFKAIIQFIVYTADHLNDKLRKNVVFATNIGPTLGSTK